MVARKTNGNGATVDVSEEVIIAVDQENLDDVKKQIGVYEGTAECIVVEPTPDPLLKPQNKFAELRLIDVGEYIEKKNGLSYLSWAYAVDMLYQHDSEANWEFLEPTVYADGSMMIWVKLIAFGKETKMHLPVLDYKNKPIISPNAFQINTAMMRCLAKVIAVGTGLGLYIYRGEDLPVDETKSNEEKVKESEELVKVYKDKFSKCANVESLKAAYTKEFEDAPEKYKPIVTKCKDDRKKELGI